MDITLHFQLREIGMDRRRAFDAERRLDIAHGRRISVRLHGLADIFVDFVFAFGQILHGCLLKIITFRPISRHEKQPLPFCLSVFFKPFDESKQYLQNQYIILFQKNQTFVPIFKKYFHFVN